MKYIILISLLIIVFMVIFGFIAHENRMQESGEEGSLDSEALLSKGSE